MVAFKIEAHGAVLIGRDRNEIASRLENCAATTEIVGAQHNVFDIRLHVDDQPGAPHVALAGEHHFLSTNRQRTVHVQASREVAVVGGALDKTVAIDRISAESAEAGHPQSVGIAQGGHRNALQHVVL
ncbi:hypothetical protein D3C84_866040 [compost metagenome]